MQATYQDPFAATGVPSKITVANGELKIESVLAKGVDEVISEWIYRRKLDS